MNPLTYPSSLQIDLDSGVFSPCAEVILRTLRDLSPVFFDQSALDEILKIENRLVYEFRFMPFQTAVSDMTFGITRIFPGTVGGEYHMTKGHFHEDPEEPEIYVCLRGEGMLLLETQSGDFKAETWRPGTVSHIPPLWAHRAVNTGSDPLVFIAFYHLSAGHDYGTIEKSGFLYRVFQQDGSPILIPNASRTVGK